MPLIAKVEEFLHAPRPRGGDCADRLRDFWIKAGDPVQDRSPNGRVKDTHIAAVELLKQTRGECRIALLLSREIAITRDEIGEGTEIWVSEGLTPRP